MFTGELPSVHGVHSYNLDFSGLTERDTIMSDLPDHEHLNVNANGFLVPEFGFNALFDRNVSIRHTRRYPEGLDAGERSVPELVTDALAHEHPFKSLANGAASKLYWLIDALPVEQVFDKGATRISSHTLDILHSTPEPFFLFLNFMEAHVPHKPYRKYDDELYEADSSWSSTEMDLQTINKRRPESLEEHATDIEHFRDLYAAAVEYLDRKISALIDDIRSLNLGETTFIITADHGENLCYPEEDYLIEHTASLSEGLLHVPLLVVNPPAGHSATTDGYLSHLDLRKMIVGVANDSLPDLRSDRISAELLGGGTSVDSDDSYWDRSIRVAYDFESRNKVQWDSLGEVTKYELEADRANWQRLVDEGGDVPDWASSLFPETLEQVNSSVQSEAREHVVENANEATRQRLEDLGYL